MPVRVARKTEALLIIYINNLSSDMHLFLFSMIETRESFLQTDEKKLKFDIYHFNCEESHWGWESQKFGVGVTKKYFHHSYTENSLPPGGKLFGGYSR